MGVPVDGWRGIRSGMGAGAIPPELDTAANLGRWWRGWRGDLAQILPRLRAYIEHRRLQGFHRQDFLETFHQRPDVGPFVGLFSLSPLASPVWDEGRRSLVFVQRMAGTDYDALLRAMSSGDFLRLMFAVTEFLFQHLLAREAETGRECGVIMVVDMTGVSRLAELMNPGSAMNRVGKLIMPLLQDYYCEVLQRFVVFNPPSVVSLLWRVAKHVLVETTLKKMAVAGTWEELGELVEIGSLPLLEGVATEGRPDGKAFDLPAPLRPSPRRGSVWQDAGLTHFQPQHLYVRPKATGCLEVLVAEADSDVVWSFITNTEVVVAVTRVAEDGSEEAMRPRLSLWTMGLAEEGRLATPGQGRYRLAFTNTSSLIFSAQIHAALATAPPTR